MWNKIANNKVLNLVVSITFITVIYYFLFVIGRFLGALLAAIF